MSRGCQAACATNLFGWGAWKWESSDEGRLGWLGCSGGQMKIEEVLKGVSSQYPKQFKHWPYPGCKSRIHFFFLERNIEIFVIMMHIHGYSIFEDFDNIEVPSMGKKNVSIKKMRNFLQYENA